MAVGAVLWEPPPDVLEHSRIGAYLRWLADDRFQADDSAEVYHRLWRWSVEQPAAFWRSIWEYFEIIDHGPATATMVGTALPGARWFPGARLNYAEHVLRMPGLADGDVAVIARSQTRGPTTLTAGQLRESVRRVRAGLRRLGVGPGDRVAAYAPNIPETLVLLLATASLGAVFSSCAPEFGSRAVVDRWRQVSPKVLVAVDGYRYGAKLVDRRAEVAAIRAALPSVGHVVWLPYAELSGTGAGTGADAGTGDDGDLAGVVPAAVDLAGVVPAGVDLAGVDLTWVDLVAATDAPLTFEPVPFEHPLYVLYSSGTTGLPKPIVHGHGGILLEHLKMLALHQDLGPGDRFFWYSTTGWMMWNYLVSGLAVGAAVVLVDGDPGYPDLGWLWRMAADTGVSWFGTSAPFLLACRKAGLRPSGLVDLAAVRGLGSTGSPLPPEGFRWVYDAVGRDLLLASISGGTDLCTAFVGGVPLLPVRAGEIACRCLGAPVDAYDLDGRSLVGALGELVITGPMPSMPVGFWNDPDGSRYREAYFGMYPGAWRHGDWITIDEHGGCVITGRSDATLNRGGVRLGTSELYTVVDSLPEVADSLVVHLDEADGGPGELVLFLVLAPGAVLDDALRGRIVAGLRTALSPRHVPDRIHQVRAVPRTLSGKRLEVPVKRILTGTPADRAAARSALADPQSLTEYEHLARASLSRSPAAPPPRGKVTAVSS